MAKKDRGPDDLPEEPPGAHGGPRPKGRRPKAKPKARPGERPPDWREIETAMWGMLGREAPDESPESPRGKAAGLLREAFRASEPGKVVALAKQAIRTWPDCADAYVLLAEHAASPTQARDLYAKGVEAGARDVGEAAFNDGVGHFWVSLPTRPYMRARLGLAQVLWVLGKRDEALDHYREMLRLNPGDNQGARYLLAAGLIETGLDVELASLLKRYGEDGSARWAYSAALLAFRREGDSPLARERLKAAKAVNPYVPDFITGKETLPTRLPDGARMGDRGEAADYAVGFLNGWRSTPGAIDWLARSDDKRRPAARARAPKPRAPKGATPAARARLKKLPLVDEVWQADARKLPVWVTSGERPTRPWIVVVANLGDEFILGQEVCEGVPTAELLWDELAKVMRDPAEGEPRRPARIQLGGHPAWSGIAADLDLIDVARESPEDLGLVDDLVRQLILHIAGRPPMPGVLEMPNVRPELAASFYQAAADFYRSAPWRRVGGAETIKVQCKQFESGPWYAVIIGQMGMTLGVALYDDRKSLLRIRESDASDEENARETVALSVTFGRENEVNVADLDAATELGWEVAGPDAYPCPVRKERGMMMRPPLAWELRLLEAVLRAFPKFLDEHDRDDPSVYQREVPTGDGPLPLELSWVSGPRLV